MLSPFFLFALLFIIIHRKKYTTYYALTGVFYTNTYIVRCIMGSLLIRWLFMGEWLFDGASVMVAFY